MYTEVQLDSLVGPTHHFAGLALGNLASHENKGAISSPQKAALQGLEKMCKVMSYGVPQLFLPPQKRPLLSFLKRVGFEGVDKAYQECPELLLTAFSSSFMWVANAGTSVPSIDSLDRKHHITPANLGSHLHRHLEVLDTTKHFQQILKDPELFVLHPSLPSVRKLFDEGAANHIRLCPRIDMPALHVFVYGGETVKFPSRQSKMASESIARLHRLPKERTIFLEQNPEAIDLGVFHNDVISVGHLNLLIGHERAFKDPEAYDHVAKTYRKFYLRPLELKIIREAEIPLELAIKTYLFNSQILSSPERGIIILAPEQCREEPLVKNYLEKLPFFTKVDYVPLNESMKNGGGPACLRLRMVLNGKELNAIPKRFWMDPRKADLLSEFVKKHYPESLSVEDFKKKFFLDNINTIYLQLEQLLEKLG